MLSRNLFIIFCFCGWCMINGEGNGYEKGEDGYFYKFHSEKKSWYDAERICNNEGALLAIESTKKVHDYITKTFSSAAMWIGASDAATEGAWKWVDETKLDLPTYWGKASNEPNGGTRENCAMTNWGSTGRWNDKYCAEEHIFLCQKHNEMKDIVKALKTIAWASQAQYLKTAGMIMLAPRGSSRYLITTGSVSSFKDQRQQCLTAGGDLASVETWEEWVHIHKELHRVRPQYPYYLGASCSKGSGYKWLTGSNVIYSNAHAFRSGYLHSCSGSAVYHVYAYIRNADVFSVENNWETTSDSDSNLAVCELNVL